VAVRGEVLLCAAWQDVRDESSERDQPIAALLGIAVDIERSGSTAPLPDTETDIEAASADLTVQGGGLSVGGSVINRRLVDNVTVRQQTGLVVHAGYRIMDDLEAFARYQYGTLDRAGEFSSSAMTMGINLYLHGHKAKLTSDVSFGPNPVSIRWAASGAGWMPDADEESGQFVWRSQIQLVFGEPHERLACGTIRRFISGLTPDREPRSQRRLPA